jgi:hypothetical protein
VKEWIVQADYTTAEGARARPTMWLGVVSRAGAADWPKQEGAVGRASRSSWQLNGVVDGGVSAERARTGCVANSIGGAPGIDTGRECAAPGWCAEAARASARLSVSGVA